MDVKQIYELVNNVAKEVLGESVLLEEDLSNIIEVGKTLANANAYENYARTLADKVGKQVVVNKIYKGNAPQVMKDSWEFGSILEKIRIDLPNATENESWELEDGTSYDEDIFYKAHVTANYWNGLVTFEIPISITDKQLKSAFLSVSAMNSFISAIQTQAENSLKLKNESLIQRTINNMVAKTIKDDFASASLSSKSGVKAINLLYEYNQLVGVDNAITKDECLTDGAFLQYAVTRMLDYTKFLSSYNTLFNINGVKTFTEKDKLHVNLLGTFVSHVDTYLKSNTYHEEFLKLPKYEEVVYWQGCGTSFAFGDISTIKVKDSDGDSFESDGILGVMYDDETLGVNNNDNRVKTKYNNKAEFTNMWYKSDTRYFNDFGENFVVFFVA